MKCEIFFKKGWFIISQPNILINYDEIIRLSKIWINIKFKKCIYHKHIMNQIEKMEKNINVSFSD